MNDKASRNQREGHYTGKVDGRHKRVYQSLRSIMKLRGRRLHSFTLGRIYK